MRILIAAAEVAPFARVGGLSDVAGSLAKEIADLGHEVSVFLPKYASIDDAAYGIDRAKGIGALSVPMGDETETVDVYEGTMPGSSAVRVFFHTFLNSGKLVI